MQRIRIECNFGSRYFTDIKKAQRYFNRCVSKHLDVEVWLVTYIYCVAEDRYIGSQVLVDYSGVGLPKY